jgi:hypothetical protein
MMASFAFLPRKVQKKTAASVTSSSLASASSLATSTSSQQVSTSAPRHDDSGVTAEGSTSGKTKGKPSQVEKRLSDDDYASLALLTLSDYALWADADLREVVSLSDDGCESTFTLSPPLIANAHDCIDIPLSTILHTQAFRTLSNGPPSQTTLARAIRTCAVGRLEVRMRVTAPSARRAWHTQCAAQDAAEEGGFDVRRVDNKGALERSSRMGEADWTARTVYIVGLLGLDVWLGSVTLNPSTGECSSVLPLRRRHQPLLEHAPRRSL